MKNHSVWETFHSTIRIATSSSASATAYPQLIHSGNTSFKTLTGCPMSFLRGSGTDMQMDNNHSERSERMSR